MGALGEMHLEPTDSLLKGAIARCREVRRPWEIIPAAMVIAEDVPCPFLQFKTSSEIACLQHASNVTSEAHMAVMRAAPSSTFEYQLESVFLSMTRRRGLKHMGYPPIIGAGRNAAILHYGRNDCAIRRDDVVLMDAGAEYRCYTADITR